MLSSGGLAVLVFRFTLTLGSPPTFQVVGSVATHTLFLVTRIPGSWPERSKASAINAHECSQYPDPFVSWASFTP
jgi:hypothetical protein